MNASTWIVMAAATLASLAIGVLAAHAMCVLMFRIFRMHARQLRTAQQVAPKAPVPSQVQA